MGDVGNIWIELIVEPVLVVIGGIDNILKRKILSQLETMYDLWCRVVLFHNRGNTVGVSLNDWLSCQCLELAPDNRKLDACAWHKFPWLG